MRRRSFLAGLGALLGFGSVAKAVPVQQAPIIEKLQNVVISDKPPSEHIVAQIIPSIHRIETKPCEYARQLKKILDQTPGMTIGQLASRLGKSAAWVRDRLSLNNLIPRVQTLVDDGEIGLSNAYYLARVMEQNQDILIGDATSLNPAIFYRLVRAYKKYTGNKHWLSSRTEFPNGWISFRWVDEVGVIRTFAVNCNPRSEFFPDYDGKYAKARI